MQTLRKLPSTAPIAAASFSEAGYVELCRPGAIAPEMAVACGEAARTGLIGALTLCVLTYALAAAFYALAGRTLRADLVSTKSAMQLAS